MSGPRSFQTSTSRGPLAAAAPPWLRCLCFLIGIGCYALNAQSAESIRCLLADGFDFPVGKPNGDGYYKARGYWPNGHLGEDWNGRGGGNSDLNAPIYATARGIVIISENVGVGWGNCIICRHAYRDETGKLAMVDSLYGHLNQRLVKVGQVVEKGQLVGTMGSNNGMYYVHLHFEMRKNLHIGMNRSSFARDNSNYYSPTAFINEHRSLPNDPQKYPIPTGLFAAYGRALADSGRDASTPTIKVPTLPSTPSLKNLAPGPSEDDEDFWSKLRTKLKEGKITEGVAPKK